MGFVGKSTKPTQPFETPEEMYLRGSLPRTIEAVDSLWLHQGDIIRAYAEKHQDTPDLALELPTGTGKTLPGLLIGEWVRRRSEGPVLYAAPTKQLSRQVAATAQREGIPVSMLTGSASTWSTADAAAVESGEAIGLTTYSGVFNSSPKVPVPRLLILDDAHAGEQFVGHEYGIEVRRSDDEATYLSVLDALKPFLSGLLMQRLQGAPDPGAHHQVRLIVPAVDTKALSNLDAALARLGAPYKFELAMIRSGLASSCVYLSYGGIHIRPMIPPTFENPVFSRARQRLYLSATLGAGGELERAFGRATIARMPLPSKTPPRSGRRFFVFPDLVAGEDSTSLTKRVVAVTDKALVLSQATVDRAKDAAAALAGDGVPVLGRDELESRGLESFADAATGVLGLANRYDGMDLPGDSCRIVVLEGKPDAVGLQERFLSERADAHAALSERIRTRIVQGAGRTTRGPNDYAVVVVRGTDLTKYFSRAENINALEPELQAEIRFGWENSRTASPDDLIDNVKTFLQHGAAWRDEGEPLVSEFREGATKVETSGAEALERSAPLEVEAWQLAFNGAWLEASQKAQKAIEALGSEATRGYRGLLSYLAAVWLHLGATDEAQRARARELMRQAHLVANRGTWIREMTPLPGAEQIDLTAADHNAVNAIVATLRGRIRPRTINAEMAEMKSALAQQEASRYERGLVTLGRYLGADSAKPKGPARCDAAWEWGTAIWTTIEAKSEEHDDGLLPVKDIRQANTQLDQLASDRGMDHFPAGSVSVLVSDRLAVDPRHSQIAHPNVYLTSPDVIASLASDAAAVWGVLIGTTATGSSESSQRKHVLQLLTDNGCLPSQVIDRMTVDRIRPGDE